MNFESNNIKQSVKNLPIFNVSELVKQIQHMLEASYREVWVEAEMSNLSKPASGHWYFSLKDKQSQIRCAMFRNRVSINRHVVKEGDLVKARGRISIYPARGDLQLIVDHIEPAGEGDLQKQFELLKDKFQKEGLFSTAHKKKLPQLPNCIGIISSSSGAAVHDILTTLKRRFPSINVIIYPATVQGSDAAKSLISAFEQASFDKRCDVIIVSRGGGSLEDLWCFNDELLIRKIYQFDIPVISAIGHEVDVTLCDFVADLRAPTPTAAAELITPDKQEIAERLNNFQRRLIRSQEQRLVTLYQNIDWLSRRLRHPNSAIVSYQKKLGDFRDRLNKAIIRRNKFASHHLTFLLSRLVQQNPKDSIKSKKNILLEYQQRSYRSIHRVLNNKKQSLIHLQKQLDAVSHQRTLERGYAMIENETEQVVTSISQIRENSNIKLVLVDGSAQAKVVSKQISKT